MATGLYPDLEIVERFLASVSASTITQRFIAPCDLDVIGMLLFVSTAPGTNNGVAVNISNVPTSQVTSVPAGAANVPTILGTATTNGVTSAPAVVANKPYALNYPLPGPSGTTGYFTAQSTSSGTSLPVTSPPSFYEYQLNALTAPDNTYTDLNNQTLTPASRLHAGDVLSFVITAAGSGASVGSAANLEIAVYCNKA
jgi:hypothetical protein